MREIERLKRGKSSVDIRSGLNAQASTAGQSSGSSTGRGKRLLTVDSRSPQNRGTSDETSGRRFRFSEEISPQQRQRQEAEAARHAQAAEGSPKSARKVHWSQVKPISENEVTGSGGVPINLADGRFDEAKQQDLFKEAVMAWRNGGKKSVSSSSSTSNGQGMNLLSAGGGLWNNPLADQNVSHEGKTQARDERPDLSSGVLDEAAERRKFQEAVAEWRNGGKPKQPQTSDASAGISSGSSAPSTTLAEKCTKSSFDGMPDEAAEHERFRRAVEDWREGKTDEGARSPGRKSTAAANDLLKKMTDDDVLRRQKFKEEKKALEEGLRRDREELRRRREEAAAKLAASKYGEDDADAGGKVSSNRDQTKKYDTKNLWQMEIEY